MFKHVCIEQESMRKKSSLCQSLMDLILTACRYFYIVLHEQYNNQAESIQANFDFLCLGVSLVERYIT